MTDDLRKRRREVLERHFQSEVDHDWSTCLATFNGVPRYEIVATGQIHEGDDAVLAYHRAVIAFFSFEGDRITNERVYLDGASLLRQIGRPELLPLAGTDNFGAADMQ